MEVPDNGHLIAEQQNNHPSLLGENEEEYLRSTWGKLGVGKDGYLDQTQLALVCECIGMEKLSDEVIAQLFDKLDLDHDGRISFGEFLHLFQNVRPGKGQMESESYEPNNWGSPVRNPSSSMRSEMLMMPSQTTMALFTTIDPQGTGFATFDATADCLRSLGVAQASSLLEALSFRHHPTQKISLRDLVGALQEEMNAGLEAGMLANSGHSGTAIHSGILLMQHELSSVRLAAEHASRECEKLRSDLQEANQRSSLLAQEVDENHAKQESIRLTQFKQLELRHSEQLRLVQEVAQADRDQLVSQLQRELDKRQQQIQQLKEEESRLKESALSMTEDNARLTAENAHLTEKLASSERANGRLMRELDGVSLMAELESRCDALEESQRNSLTEQLNRLSAENLELRDRTDELLAEVELLRGQLSAAKSDCSNGLMTTWRSEPSVSGAVKRRSDGAEESDSSWVEDVNHTGKMRKKEAYQMDSSIEVSPIPHRHHNGWNGTNDSDHGEGQSLAAQLQEVKHINNSPMVVSAGSTIKEQLKRVFEKLRLQIVEEFLEGNDSVATLQSQYRNVLMQQEERHVDEKRFLTESYLLKLSAIEAQLVDSQIRCEDLVQLQSVMEAEHEMELKDLRHQLKRVHSKDTKQEDYENLTEALADLDAALEKELTRCNDELQIDGESSSKVEELEKQCKTLETELDTVKVEIVKIVLENEELRQTVKKQQKELEAEQREADERMEEKVEYETALLQQRIKKLIRENEDEKKRHQQEKNALDEDRRDLESRLDMLRAEFERLDDYWQAKMDEERELYDQERASVDKEFQTLETKIKEYEELLGQGDNMSTSSLSTIEERANWEKQLTDMEEESQAQLAQIADLETQLDRLRSEREVEIARLTEERDKIIAESDNIKSLLAEAVEREEKLIMKYEMAAARTSPTIKATAHPQQQQRPVSPNPNPGILPSGYSPLKSKGWARSQRSPGHNKSPVESSSDGVDGRIPQPLSRSSSLNIGSSDYLQQQQQHHRFERVDISMLHALNARLKQAEQRCRGLHYALQHQKRRTEQIMLESQIQHQEEINSLEMMMNTSQDTLRQMTVNHQKSLDKLSASDRLIFELYTENASLLQVLNLHNLSPMNNTI